MVQSILFFSLGFLTAGFLALMVAPAIWRRAVALTRKRIEASVPLTMTEIQADKDRMRAEFAMSTRRLEMSIGTFREKASTQLIEINRNRDELRRLSDERAEKDRSLSELEARGSEVRAELRRREDELQKQTDRLADADRLLEAKALEVEKLGRMYDEATLTSSTRQIELVARETEYERLSNDVGDMRNQRKEADRLVRSAEAEVKAAQEASKEERKRAAELDRKVQRLLGTVADRETKLEQREAELARLRESHGNNARQGADLDARLTEAQADRVKLEAELADLQLQMSTLLSGATGGDVEKAIATLTAEKDNQEERLTLLLRENKKLKTDLQAVERASAEGWNEERRDGAVLREQINDLAAQVVHLTAMLDGPDSPINRIIADATPPASGQGIVSLADRIRALQKAASAQAG